MENFVCGIGFNDKSYPTKIGGKIIDEYSVWSSMLLRCTQKYWDKFPTYIGTTCSENFKSYSYFYEWCQSQVGFKNKEESGKSWQLDKDILIKGNKLYGEDTCVFVPSTINNLIVKCDSSRGDFSVGVCWCKRSKKFVAQCSSGLPYRWLGYFNTEKEAFQAYKTFKEQTIKKVANEYKEAIDSRVYAALMVYEVNVND